MLNSLNDRIVLLVVLCKAGRIHTIASFVRILIYEHNPAEAYIITHQYHIHSSVGSFAFKMRLKQRLGKRSMRNHLMLLSRICVDSFFYFIFPSMLRIHDHSHNTSPRYTVPLPGPREPFKRDTASFSRSN